MGIIFYNDIEKGVSVMAQLVYLLPFIAGLGFIVGVVLLIYQAVKKKPKKVSVIIIVVSIILGIIGLVLSANQAVSDFSGGKMKGTDIIYVNSIGEPINKMNEATYEYTALINNPDPQNPEWIERHDDAVAKLQEATKEFEEVKPGPNTKEIAEEAKLITKEVDNIAINSKTAFAEDDVDKHMELMKSAESIMNHYLNITKHLENLAPELN